MSARPAGSSGISASAKPPDVPSPGRVGLGSEVSAKRAQLQLPPRLALGAWTRIGKQIGLLRSCSAWWLGDWLIYGRENFPDRYKQAMAGTSLDYQTLRNYAWVAGRFAVSRRRDTLSFQHHAAVAALPGSQQDLWLDLASSRSWSIAQLRAELNAASGNTAVPGRRGTVLRLSIPADRRERWEAAARKHQATLADWVISVLDNKASQDPGDQ